MRFVNRRSLSLILLLFFSSTLLVACGGNGDADQSRRDDVAVRETVFERAERLFPVPPLQNFPLREALVKFTARQDEVNHPWYIYIYSMTGEPLGYYVGQTYPISSCNFLSSSEKIIDVPHDGDSIPDFIVGAPSLDGMFYGGGGSSAACQSMFFFDATTDAMITFSADTWIAIDVPVAGFTGQALGPTTIEDVDEVPATPVGPELPPAATEEPAG